MIIDLIRRVYLSLLVWPANHPARRHTESPSGATEHNTTETASPSFVAQDRAFGGPWFCPPYLLCGALLLMYTQETKYCHQITYLHFIREKPPSPPHKSHGDYVVVPIQITFYCCPAHFICLVNYWSREIVIFTIANKSYANSTRWWWPIKFDGQGNSIQSLPEKEMGETENGYDNLMTE